MSRRIDRQPREGQTFAHRGSRWLVYANFVKLPHTVFALPFALVGVMLASYRAPVTWRDDRVDRARVHLRALRGDGVQSHRRSRVSTREIRARASGRFRAAR